MTPRTIQIDGKRYVWHDLVALRRAQLAAARQAQQPVLFALIDDCRPASQRRADGRYASRCCSITDPALRLRSTPTGVIAESVLNPTLRGQGRICSKTYAKRKTLIIPCVIEQGKWVARNYSFRPCYKVSEKPL
jgi:hypothetical protein